MWSFTPSATPKPWVKAVLPAPSSPASRITSPGRASSASAAANDWVSVADRDRAKRVMGRGLRSRGRQGELGPDEVGAHLSQRLAAAPQRVGRVEGRDEHGVAEGVLLAA